MKHLVSIRISKFLITEIINWIKGNHQAKKAVNTRKLSRQFIGAGGMMTKEKGKALPGLNVRIAAVICNLA
jgi:hypothetical protein